MSEKEEMSGEGENVRKRKEYQEKEKQIFITGEVYVGRMIVEGKKLFFKNFC